MYVLANELSVSKWLPREPRYGFDCAVLTKTKHTIGWKSVNCSSRHTAFCVSGKIIIIMILGVDSSIQVIIDIILL